MSRHPLNRNDRFAQMSKQEEIIAKKRLEILEKQKTAELAKAVAAAQSQTAKLKSVASANDSKDDTDVNCPTAVTPPVLHGHDPTKIQNTFCNDGSFLAHFKQILEKHEPPALIPPLAIPDSSSLLSDLQQTNTEEFTSGFAVETSIACEVANAIIDSDQQVSFNQGTIPSFSLPLVVNDLTNQNEQQQQQQQQQQHLQQQQHPQQQQQQQQEKPHQQQQQQQEKPHQQQHLQQHHQMKDLDVQQQQQQQHHQQQHQPQHRPQHQPLHQHIEPASFSPHSQFFNPSIPPPLINLHVRALPPPPPPPPPPQQMLPNVAPLYMIPPPEPLQLNTIPPPKDFDLNAIPKPQLNLDAIKIPIENEKVFSDNNDQIAIPTSVETLIELVADYGDEYEDKIRSRKNDIHPELWFLFEKDSDSYFEYRKQVEELRQNQQQLMSSSSSKSSTSVDDKYDPESAIGDDSDDEYMRGMMDRNRDNLKRRIECRNELSEEERENARQKKIRKSRWGDKIENFDDDLSLLSAASSIATSFGNQNKPILSAIQRTDPQLLQYARLNYGTTNLSEDDWKKCEEHFKVNLLYQDMMRKRQEIDRLARIGKFKYEYDSDEDISGGTWEHKLRTAEMEATQAWASALTKQSEGKHHIGDFLPPEELKKFMEQYEAKKNNRMPDLSDYKEYKLGEDNIGFQMLQKLGWKEGQGLGSGGSGIVDPVNKAPQREGNQGLGITSAATPEDCDNEYEAYRKRMMLAYRFRPNPLNNPRRAYY